MSENRTPGTPGQGINPSTTTATTEPDLLAEVEAPEPQPDKKGPITELSPPAGRSLAWLSDGSVALSVHYVEGANLAGCERWEGVILDRKQAEKVLEGLSDTADAVGANIGRSSRWRKGESEGSSGDV